MHFNDIPNDERQMIISDYAREGISLSTTYKEMYEVDFFLYPIQITDTRVAVGVFLDLGEDGEDDSLFFVRDMISKEQIVESLYGRTVEFVTEWDYGFCANLTS